MESNFLTAVFLPLALFIIMLGMGLGLTLDDFKRVLVEPKAVILGLIAQLIMLPVVGFLLASIFPLTPELAVGLMILAACPGGSTSNMITYLVKGNVALSITLTAVSSLITVFTIPLVINFSMENFMGQGVALQLPFVKTVVQIAVITLIPITIGMLLHRYLPKFAMTVEKGVKWLSLFFLGLIIVGLLLKERDNVASFFLQVGGVTLTLNILTMALGYGLSTLSNLDKPSSKSITVEVGIQNGTLAIAIASTPTLLNMPTMAIPAAIYALIMFATSAVFGWLLRQQSNQVVQNRDLFSELFPLSKEHKQVIENKVFDILRHMFGEEGFEKLRNYSSPYQETKVKFQRLQLDVLGWKLEQDDDLSRLYRNEYGDYIKLDLAIPNGEVKKDGKSELPIYRNWLRNMFVKEGGGILMCEEIAIGNGINAYESICKTPRKEETGIDYTQILHLIKQKSKPLSFNHGISNSN